MKSEDGFPPLLVVLEGQVGRKEPRDGTAHGSAGRLVPPSFSLSLRDGLAAALAGPAAASGRGGRFCFSGFFSSPATDMLGVLGDAGEGSAGAGVGEGLGARTGGMAGTGNLCDAADGVAT